MDRSNELGDAPRRPTIHDVAERAKVSKSLVSLVLRNSSQVRAEKRQAVLAAIEELGYRPNAAARSLSEQRTRTIGVLLSDLRNPWFVELLDGLNSVLHERGLHVLLADGHLNRRLGEDLTRTFLELGVDGIVAVGTLPDPSALTAASTQVPMVVAGTREPELPGVDIVAGDDLQGARLVTEHLLSLGHRAIAHISGPGAVGQLRRRGFETTLLAHGLGEAMTIEPGDLTEEGGYRATIRLLRRDVPPTAIFAFNDLACIGALTAAEESGLRVPADLSLAGYDNTYLAQLRHLWLTSVDNASRDVGRQAAACILARLGDRSRPAGLLLTTPSLIVRGTTAPPPG